VLAGDSGGDMREVVTDLALLFEHPLWFLPLFEALERRGVDHVALRPDGHFDPADRTAPARVVFNRIAMSSFLRAEEHPIFHAMALLDHWRRAGARVINGPEVMGIDSSKARQLSLIAGLGLAIPETRVVHRIADVEAAAATLSFPLVVKANIGGAGAGIMRYDSMDELRAAIADKSLPTSVDGVLLVQDYVPARGGTITRIETLDRKYLYALDIAGAGAFDLSGTAALLKRARCTVAGDTGVMHLATAVQTPVVTLLGPTVREFGFLPYNARSTIVERDLDCRPCSKMGGPVCPLGHHHCLEWIAAEEVAEAVRRLPQ